MNTKILFDKFKLGDLLLKNRIIMSPMTRCRTDPVHGIPNDLMVKYYSDRSDAGLIITECAWVDKRGNGYLGAGGLTNTDQMEGWRKVVKAVHEKGGLIFAQLYHSGRIFHPKLGSKAQAPSVVKIEEDLKMFTGAGFDNIPEPEEMTVEDIKTQTERFKTATELALKAGFDGVEIHAANGYLLDSFLRDHTNRRTDAYGGSVEKRAKFPLEVVDNAVKIFGSKRVGIKVSPVGRFDGMYDSDPVKHYTYIVKELVKRKLSYISMFEFEGYPKSPYGSGFDQIKNCAKTFKPLFGDVPLMTTGQINTIDEAVRRVTDKEADLVCFGKPYISNPDFATRLKNGWTLAQADPNTFYTPGEKGYNDYPFYKA